MALQPDPSEPQRLIGDNTSEVITLSSDTANAPLGVWMLAGDDQVTGSTANDFVYGNDGEDLIRGGLGNDSLFGGKGDLPRTLRSGQQRHLFAYPGLRKVHAPDQQVPDRERTPQ